MKYSVKKTLGVIGSCVIFIISLYGTYKDVNQIPNILWPLITFVSALFGIKKFGTPQAVPGKEQ